MTDFFERDQNVLPSPHETEEFSSAEYKVIVIVVGGSGEDGRLGCFPLLTGDTVTVC